MGTPRSVAPAASAAMAVKDMQNVTKLALLRESSFWMEQLVDSFPALTELHIFTQYCPDGPAIVRFLASRKQRDLKVRTLYFFGDQASKHCRDFVKWRESPQEFSCHVERVVFEETPFRCMTEICCQRNLEYPKLVKLTQARRLVRYGSHGSLLHFRIHT
ncbi:hypothetical protein BC629DRAFT_975414 [Irpex lacteus]|nr:hypothetical protein BC629DRAFT_975414 [Irpex lacteus]